MFTVYIIYSPTKDKYYIGYTSEQPEELLRKHNTITKDLLEIQATGKLFIPNLFRKNKKQWRVKKKSKTGKAEKE